jgi:hypothetical protein
MGLIKVVISILIYDIEQKNLNTITDIIKILHFQGLILEFSKYLPKL